MHVQLAQIEEQTCDVRTYLFFIEADDFAACWSKKVRAGNAACSIINVLALLHDNQFTIPYKSFFSVEAEDPSRLLLGLFEVVLATD